ncbi:hypothetical protein KCP73_23835 [Salmonella enterica subsp. enterica]|nr:hypothetical protein KCP73_23835 [Salmonella enterica subsp. enterica]
MRLNARRYSDRLVLSAVVNAGYAVPVPGLDAGAPHPVRQGGEQLGQIGRPASYWPFSISAPAAIHHLSNHPAISRLPHRVRRYTTRRVLGF